MKIYQLIFKCISRECDNVGSLNDILDMLRSCSGIPAKRENHSTLELVQDARQLFCQDEGAFVHEPSLGLTVVPLDGMGKSRRWTEHRGDFTGCQTRFGVDQDANVNDQTVLMIFKMTPDLSSIGPCPHYQNAMLYSMLPQCNALCHALP